MVTEQPGIARRSAITLLVVVVASLVMAILGTATASADDAPVIDESFETGPGVPAGWTVAEYAAGASTFTIAAGAAADGNHFLHIVSGKPNHARVVIRVPVKASTTYAFRASAKSSGADSGQAAAVLGVEGTYTVTDSVRTDKGWQPLELLFETGSKTSVELALSLGYFGSANVGTASFDSVTVTSLAAAPADKPVADLGGRQADGAADTARRSAADTAGANSRGPSNVLWPVLAILAIGGAAVAVFLARHAADEDSASAGHGAELDGDKGGLVKTKAGSSRSCPRAGADHGVDDVHRDHHTPSAP